MQRISATWIWPYLLEKDQRKEHVADTLLLEIIHMFVMPFPRQEL